jgi:hypothetical protein
MTLYADAAKLDKLSRKKMWSVWAWIGNFPKHIRMSTVGKGGAILLGFLPEVNKLKCIFQYSCFEQILGSRRAW